MNIAIVEDNQIERKQFVESIERFLNVFERVNAKQPFQTRFIIDHAETISERND